MPHRKVDFSHSRTAFDLLCPFVSSLLLPGELRRAKLVMMPQQAGVFHQPVLEKTAKRWKPSVQERGHSPQQHFRPKTVYLGHMAEGITVDVKCPHCQTLRGHALRLYFPFPSVVQHWGPLGLRCNN